MTKKKGKKLKNETFFYSEIALELEDLLERFRDFLNYHATSALALLALEWGALDIYFQDMFF